MYLLTEVSKFKNAIKSALLKNRGTNDGSCKNILAALIALYTLVVHDI